MRHPPSTSLIRVRVAWLALAAAAMVAGAFIRTRGAPRHAATGAPAPAARLLVLDGYSQDRRRVASNDFVITGPAGDPAGVGRAASGAAALAKIAAARQPFVSRGDQSGTHLKEQALWKAAQVHPRGEWYLSSNV